MKTEAEEFLMQKLVINELPKHRLILDAKDIAEIMQEFAEAYHAEKESSLHVMEFIAWLRLNCDTGNGYWDIGDLTDYYDYEIYQYWLINIKNK